MELMVLVCVYQRGQFEFADRKRSNIPRTFSQRSVIPALPDLLRYFAVTFRIKIDTSVWEGSTIYGLGRALCNHQV